MEFRVNLVGSLRAVLSLPPTRPEDFVHLEKDEEEDVQRESPKEAKASSSWEEKAPSFASTSHESSSSELFERWL